MIALLWMGLTVTVCVIGSGVAGRQRLRQIQEDAETDAFLDVLAQIRNDQSVPRDVAHVHRLAEQFTADAASDR